MDTRYMLEEAKVRADEYYKLEKEWWRVSDEEYFVDKHFDVIFPLSFVISIALFAILLVITKSLGLAYMSAFICIVIFFSVIIVGKIMFNAEKQERLREIEDKQDKAYKSTIDAIREA